MCYCSSVGRTSRLLACVGGCLSLALGAPAPPAPPNPVAPALAQAAAAPEDADAGQAAEPAAEEAPAPQAPPNPYQAIHERNIFGLKPPPPPTAPPDPQAQVTPSALKLVCITALLGKRAGFVLQEPGKPQVNSELLREGEKDSCITNLEVRKIDVRAMTVQVMYGNKELTLDFKSNGIAPPVGPALAPPGQVLAGKPGGPAGAPVALGPGQPAQPVTAASLRPGPAQPGTYATDSSGGLRPIPTRPTRLGSDGSTGYGGGPVGGPARYGYNQPIPAQTQPYVQPVPAQTQPTLSPEQQVLIMKAQEQHAARQGIPFPPTPPVPGVDYQPATPGSAQGQQTDTQLPPVPGAPIPLPPTPRN